jgi:hypothetical protein
MLTLGWDCEWRGPSLRSSPSTTHPWKGPTAALLPALVPSRAARTGR